MDIDGYKILEKIGQGGMAQVYKGYQISLQRPVAIKVLTHSFTDKPDFIQRFEKESIIIARLSNPFIIPVIERGLTKGGIPFFVMELVEGDDLGKIMGKGQLDFNRKLDICIQICKALSYAHRNNVIHRDIKPANVLIDNDGNARVLDFGIAQYYEGEATNNDQTEVGMVMGTMAYMSPEQRKSAASVTFRSDLFSLGVLMYKLFTHQDPVGRFKSPAELAPEIPASLSNLILKCLESRPEDRPASADEIKDGLLVLLRGAHIQTEQREQVKKDFKQFDLLDVIKDDAHSSVMLFENRSSKKLIIIKKRLVGEAGFNEAKQLTPLRHPNLVKILGTSENKRNYIIVMEYLNGGNLQDRMVQAMSWREFISMAQEIAAGLEFAHNNKILHGNLRPSNILFDQSGHVKVTDFGLEEHYQQSKHINNWYRLPKEKISPALDIFSVGVIYYQMLTGVQPAFDNNRYESNTIFKKLPAKLKQLITHMIQLRTMDRMSDFSKVKAILDEIASEGSETLVISHKPSQRQKKHAKKNNRIVLILLLISILGFLVFWVINLNEIQTVFKNAPEPEEFQEEQPSFIELN